MRVAIAGYGIEGKASYNYWKNQGCDVVVVDENEFAVQGVSQDIDVLAGPGVFSDLNGFDLVVRTASLRPDSIKTDGRVWSATNEFFATCPAQIVGVTGTKGKGTTCSLITSMLRAAGKTVHLVGNIGTPALDVLPHIQKDDIVVYELSSFQLWDLQKSPHTAVVLGIEPDHLDVHSSFQEYVDAKTNIVRHQTGQDRVVFLSSNAFSTAMSRFSPGAKVPYPDESAIHCDGEWFYDGEDKLFSRSSLRLPGRHNEQNTCAALSTVKLLLDSWHGVEQGLQMFDGLEHRIKLVREVKGVAYYDDSYSSAPSASLAALRSFEAPKIIMLGGFDRGISYADFAGEMGSIDALKLVVLYGETRQKLYTSLVEAGIDIGILHKVDSPDFSEVFAVASKAAEPGDVVILSPGCPSFDMFRNFTERGEAFIKLAETL